MSRTLKTHPTRLNVATIVPCTEAEGPGKRFALWVQGCPMRCPGCCNPEMLEFLDKEWRETDEILAEILRVRDAQDIEGVTFLGGEPFAQPEALARLAAGVREHGLTVMIFTGFTLESLQKTKRAGVAELLAQTDLLVDGQFERDKIDSKRRWIGSENQRPFDLTGAYTELVNNWDETSETIEIRIVDGKLQVNGSPFLLNKLYKL